MPEELRDLALQPPEPSFEGGLESVDLWFPSDASILSIAHFPVGAVTWVQNFVDRCVQELGDMY